MAGFVDHRSIVRAIWGNPDLILLIFAGSAAEFALNRAVDWLFFTGGLPQDPLGRLFSTARFAQEIVFGEEAAALQTLDRIAAIHRSVERQRGDRIPDWAHRDVLYMLIDYSERGYRLLYRPLAAAEQQELYAVFYRVGERLQIPELPSTYTAWQTDRHRHLERDLAYTQYTPLLYRQYRQHLGAWRYDLLLQVQALLVPEKVHRLLRLPSRPLLSHLLWIYEITATLELQSLIQRLLLPTGYLHQIRRFDRASDVG